MTDDAGDKLLATVERIEAEMRCMRELMQQNVESTKTLRGQRERRAASQKKWRRSVSGESTRRVSVESTPGVVVLDQEQREDLKQVLPARLDKASTSAPTAAVWESYSDAYELRHGVRPPDSAKNRSQLKQFLGRVPAGDSPAIAAFFLTHNDALYIRAKHPIDLLLRDAQKLYAEWFTGKTVTATEARQQDATQANIDGWGAHRRKPNGVVGR